MARPLIHPPPSSSHNGQSASSTLVHVRFTLRSRSSPMSLARCVCGRRCVIVSRSARGRLAVLAFVQPFIPIVYTVGDGCAGCGGFACECRTRGKRLRALYWAGSSPDTCMIGRMTGHGVRVRSRSRWLRSIPGEIAETRQQAATGRDLVVSSRPWLGSGWDRSGCRRYVEALWTSRASGDAI